MAGRDGRDRTARPRSSSASSATARPAPSSCSSTPTSPASATWRGPTTCPSGSEAGLAGPEPIARGGGGRTPHDRSRRHRRNWRLLARPRAGVGLRARRSRPTPMARASRPRCGRWRRPAAALSSLPSLPRRGRYARRCPRRPSTFSMASLPAPVPPMPQRRPPSGARQRREDIRRMARFRRSIGLARRRGAACRHRHEPAWPWPSPAAGARAAAPTASRC